VVAKAMQEDPFRQLATHALDLELAVKLTAEALEITPASDRGLHDDVTDALERLGDLAILLEQIASNRARVLVSEATGYRREGRGR
jgi:hypothetical protein